jgi:V-type H+-transporting ATPase subunit C
MPALTVEQEPADQYLRTFTWNKVKYRADKPLAELIDTLQKVCGRLDNRYKLALLTNVQELVSIDNDVKAKVTQYNSVKTNLTTLQRKQTLVYFSTDSCNC